MASGVTGGAMRRTWRRTTAAIVAGMGATALGCAGTNRGAAPRQAARSGGPPPAVSASPAPAPAPSSARVLSEDLAVPRTTPAPVAVVEIAPPPPTSRAERAHVLEEVRASSGPGSVTVSLLADGVLEGKDFVLENPPRLVIDLP